MFSGRLRTFVEDQLAADTTEIKNWNWEETQGFLAAAGTDDPHDRGFVAADLPHPTEAGAVP